MGELSHNPSWLAQPNGAPVAIQGACSIGRASTNEIVLADDKVSRRHAIVHAQGQNEYWLVDLGSSNGTHVNGRRVSGPSRLRDQDVINIGPFHLTFHQPVGGQQVERERSKVATTFLEIQSAECWLLVGDIVGSTQLVKRVLPAELPVMTGRWFDTCKQIIDHSGGGIDKFLGDGFFAFWPGDQQIGAEIARVLRELQEIQMSGQPPFRVVVHYGCVNMGGLATMGGARLFGAEVNFTFRMERLASSLAAPCLVSEAAWSRLDSHLVGRPLGEHPLNGFDGKFRFFAL